MFLSAFLFLFTYLRFCAFAWLCFYTFWCFLCLWCLLFFFVLLVRVKSCYEKKKFETVLMTSFILLTNIREINDEIGCNKLRLNLPAGLRTNKEHIPTYILKENKVGRERKINYMMHH